MEPTPEMMEMIEKEKCGEITKEEIREALDRRYKKAEKLVAAQVIDPGQGSFRGGDYILLSGVVKIAELHSVPPYV